MSEGAQQGPFFKLGIVLGHDKFPDAVKFLEHHFEFIGSRQKLWIYMF